MTYMKQNSFIYLRGLKHAAFTVFCVENGQKFYYDPQFNVRVPFSSGQQVKRSVLEKTQRYLRRSALTYRVLFRCG